jgi:hypothetical protein
LYPKGTLSRQPQTIFVETPDPFPKCWRGNTGILECDALYSRRVFNLFGFNSSLLIAQTVGWAGRICPRARRDSSVGTLRFAHPTLLFLSPQRPTQKQEGPVRVAEQRRSDRGIPRGLFELCATMLALATNRFRKASSAAACRFE